VKNYIFLTLYCNGSKLKIAYGTMVVY